MIEINCFYSIFAKKRNSHGHFKYIKKHKIIHRNCCSGVITLCSPKNFLVILGPRSTVLDDFAQEIDGRHKRRR